MIYKKEVIIKETRYKCDFCDYESDFLPCCMMCHKQICDEHRTEVELDGYSCTRGRIYYICPECIEKYTVKQMNDKYNEYRITKE